MTFGFLGFTFAIQTYLNQMMKNNRTNILLAAGLILLAVVVRIVNYELHIYNLAPVAALGLFSGSILKNKRIAYLLPLLAMFVSDAYIQLFTPMQGFYDISQFFVYGAMAIITFMGTTMKNNNAIRVAGYSIAGSAIFFVLSNFGTYLTGLWGYGFEGLTTTYLMALPFYTKEGTSFFANTFIGDLVFSGLLFGAYAVLKQAISGKVARA